MEIIPYLSFFTGVISILSPCILPILPIFLGFNIKSRSKVEILSFTLGLMSIFGIIIILTAFFTEITYSYINYIRIISAVILFVMGLSLIFNYNVKFKSISAANKKFDEGVVNSFVLGIFTSIAWTPCYSAYLISLIALIVSLNNTTYAILNLVLYCLGFGFTLFILSLVMSKINVERLLSRTKHVSKIFGVLIIVSSIYLLLTTLGTII